MIRLLLKVLNIYISPMAVFLASMLLWLIIVLEERTPPFHALDRLKILCYALHQHGQADQWHLDETFSLKQTHDDIYTITNQRCLNFSVRILFSVHMPCRCFLRYDILAQ